MRRGYRTLLCLGFVLGFAAPARADTAPHFVLKWGAFGTGPGMFDGPSDVQSDAVGYVYVTDPGNRRVQKFTNAGVYVDELDLAVSGPYPGSCAIDQSGNLYVVDSNGAIEIFDAGHGYIRTWTLQGYTYRVAIDRSRHLLYAVTGSTAERFSLVKLDLTTGQLLSSWFWGYFRTPYFPNGFGVGPSGCIYIGAGITVEKYSSDGTLLRTWGGIGGEPGQFASTRGIGVDAMENVYVADGNARVQKFTSEGAFLTVWGSIGNGDGQFSSNLPAIAIDASGGVCVLDHDQNRVQKFDGAATPARATSWGALKSRFR